MKNRVNDHLIIFRKDDLEKIWSFIKFENLIVIDFGVGESTKKLVNLGANVVAVDKEVGKLNEYRGKTVLPIRCDIVYLPIRERAVDLSVFYFTLHEIDPVKHEKVISTVSKISLKIMVVEPSPEGCKAYNRFIKLWREAMHSVSRFEDYKPASYWKSLIEKCGFKIRILKTIEQKWQISIPELEYIIQDTIKKWRELFVSQKYIGEVEAFLKQVKRTGMKWSDLILIIGESKELD